jgi:CTP:phosphocholine cytidylyltransferase-like protein/thiamine kinase-like enzyme
VEEIYVVVGYMKEKFFYLEQKYGVRLIVNNQFGAKGNLYSVYVAREHLENTFLCCADHYFVDNPFLYENPENRSYRVCSYLPGKFREFAVECTDAGVISAMTVGGQDSLAMVGPAYLNQGFSRIFRERLEAEIDDFGVAAMFWEEFYARHIRQLTFYQRQLPREEVLEFDSIDDLRAFDGEFLLNVDSQIISNICRTLACDPNSVTDISVIHAGLTNVSFAFVVGGDRYVYRHPGGTAGNLVDRQAELFTQMAAKERGLDKSVIYMDPTGWKISHFVPGAKNCDFDDDRQLATGMEYLRRLHAIRPDKTVKVFDNLSEGKRLMAIASAAKGDLAAEFAPLIDKTERLYELVQDDARRLGFDRVLCHNDTYAPNYLIDDNGEIYLIDWEYAGLNYAANDLGCILCRYDWTDEEIARYLRAFVGREPTADERRYYMAFIPISAFYWFCWGLYKGSVGDDDSFFFLPAYRNLVRFIDRALESYGVAP